MNQPTAGRFHSEAGLSPNRVITWSKALPVSKRPRSNYASDDAERGVIA
jgi:hypothetical protein